MLRIAKGGRLFYHNKDMSKYLLDFLGENCTIDKGVCFKDILNLISKHQSLSYLLTRGPWLSDIIKEGKKSFKDHGDIKYLEVGRYYELRKGKTNELEEATYFSGIGKEHYSLDFSPINTLTKFEVRLNPICKIFEYSSKGFNLFLKVNQSFTLLEILRTMFWELTFFGSPKDRDQKSNELIKTVTKLKEKDCIPFKEFVSKLSKKIKKPTK